MQMAVAYSAIANGGKVLWPRLVERVEPQDPASGESPTEFPAGIVRDEIGVQPRSLKILYNAMLAKPRTRKARARRRRARAARLRQDRHGAGQKRTRPVDGWDYWFASFAPYENPRYAVIVMVQSENRGSGGSVCAPIAHDIYEAILKSEKPDAPALAAARRGEPAN